MEHHHVSTGKSTISMAMFNSKLLVYQRVCVFALKTNEWIGKVLRFILALRSNARMSALMLR